MKILHAVAYYPPHRVGGIGEVAKHLHHGLLAQGHDSVVLTSGSSENDPLIMRIAVSPFKYVTSLGKYAKLAKKFDVVHCHQGETIALPFMMKLRRIKTPFLMTFHVGSRGMAHACRPYNLDGKTFRTGWKGWLYRNITARCHQFTNWLALRIADETSFISRSSAKDNLGAAKAVTANIDHNGVGGEIIDKNGISPEPADILYVGNNSHRKRVMALPFLLKYIRQSIPKARLRMIGVDMKSIPELTRLLDEFNLKGAVVCEGVLASSNEINPYYRASKVLVVPSVYEGLPMVILEALQNSLPCVVTRVSGHPEVIQDGINGFLVEKDNPEQMANRCIEILRNDQLQKRMGEASRQFIDKKFDNTRMVSRYMNLYSRMCKQ
ncbi:MAG: glycosyltransferase family 4 protein [Deltaproteobacteria bacterium]|nr:glycosyltransferase family 4 protein [Deltaproteobacteria bacterium]